MIRKFFTFVFATAGVVLGLMIICGILLAIAGGITGEGAVRDIGASMIAIGTLSVVFILVSGIGDIGTPTTPGKPSDTGKQIGSSEDEK
jgi:hypothetical protein